MGTRQVLASRTNIGKIKIPPSGREWFCQKRKCRIEEISTKVRSVTRIDLILPVKAGEARRAKALERAGIAGEFVSRVGHLVVELMTTVNAKVQ